MTSRRTPVALVGPSGAGKTSVIASLIGHYSRRGDSVSVIKHSHHELSHAPRGDTEVFLDAGATEAILASGRRAVAFRRAPVRFSFLWDFEEIFLLPAMTVSSIVLIEGFKSVQLWPRLFVSREGIRAPALTDEAAAGEAASAELGVGRGAKNPSGDATFLPGQIAELAAFIDRITAR
ncbi:MAG: molybdopterin-guanine dinucleotide biosynthesis protein MobB [Acidobacteriota bacterium]